MRAATILPVLALTLAVGACDGPKSQEFTRADREAIQQANQNLMRAFNAKDVDSIIPLYAAESLLMPPNNPSLRGHEAVRSYYSGLIDEGATALRTESDEISGHGPIAFQSGSYTLHFNGDGKASRDRGKYVRVLRNVGGTWRIEKTIWSSDLPKPAIMSAD